MGQKVILFVFAGRRQNLEIQFPLVDRILQENPDVEYHIWNTARMPQDAQFVKGIQPNDRTTVFNQFYDQNGCNQIWRFQNNIYKHYSHSKYKDCLFVKIDDDVIFLETARFADFVNQITPKVIISAKTVNNGASTPLEPAIFDGFQKLDIPLLDIHMSVPYVEMAHNYFLNHADKMTEQPMKRFPSKTWLSVNAVAYDWKMICLIASTIGKRSPVKIADRDFPLDALGRAHTIGDEGVCNTVPRVVIQGFTAAHLTFGPQDKAIPNSTLNDLRHRYKQVGEWYLTRHPAKLLAPEG
jgi:hypothetical protein